MNDENTYIDQSSEQNQNESPVKTFEKDKVSYISNPLSEHASEGKPLLSEDLSPDIADIDDTQLDEHGILMSEYEDMNDLMDPTILKLDEIHDDIKGLQREFQSKLKYDSHKNRIIDDLHQELQIYKNDIIKKHLNSVMMDIIQFIDNTRKLSRYYQDQDYEDADPVKLLKILEDIPSDMEAIVARQGIIPFTCEDEKFDPGRQRVLKRIKTPEQARDRTIAESIHPGYEWEGRMIRPEIVAVYVYKPGHDETQTEGSDE